MDKKRIEEATALFQSRFDKTPAESGYPVIDAYRKQRVYLFGESEEAIHACKTSQDIIRWLMFFSLWPLVVDAIAIIYFWLVRRCYQEMMVAIVFGACWVVLLLVLCYKGIRAYEQQENKVIWLNY